MSIEKALADLTAAVDRNTAALSAGGATPKTSKKQTAETPLAAPPAAAAAAPAATSTPPVAPVAAAAAATVPFKNVADALVLLAETKNADGTTNRDAAVALLADFGAKNVPGLKPEQYADFIAKATAKAKSIADGATAPAAPAPAAAAGLY